MMKKGGVYEVIESTSLEALDFFILSYHYITPHRCGFPTKNSVIGDRDNDLSGVVKTGKEKPLLGRGLSHTTHH
jgi:hypothetical protein